MHNRSEKMQIRTSFEEYRRSMARSASEFIGDLKATRESSELRAANLNPSVAKRMREIMAADKLDEKAALKKVAKERGIGKAEAYREWQKSK